METPEHWTIEWQAALQRAKTGVASYRTGLRAEEFASLAGTSASDVTRYARLGIKKFRERFGVGCSFSCSGSKTRWSFTFVGVISTSARDALNLEVIPAKEFSKLHGVSEITVRRRAARGHDFFRHQFPGWDFVEIESFTGSGTYRWFGRIEEIGEQVDKPLPETGLTVRQFVRLIGRSEDKVRRLINKGNVDFEKEFPGWTFRRVTNRKVIIEKL